MRIHKKSLIPYTHELRRNLTPWEQKLWYHLRAHRLGGFKFKRQVMIGEYIVDFCCNQKKLIVELDGGQHNQDIVRNYDDQRKDYLQSEGYIVLRFWNNEIDSNLEGVVEIILRSLKDT